jgi:tRNA(Ile2) C34 agmatinyltransferase TiaS
MRERMKRCKVCGGVLEILGKLGRLTWYRCRNCGMEFSEK